MFRTVKIRHPDWLGHSDPGKTLNMVREKRLPESIAGWMLVVSLKHPLRAIYGSDVRAAWALLLWAIEGWIEYRKYSLLWALHLVKCPECGHRVYKGKTGCNGVACSCQLCHDKTPEEE